MRMKKKLWTQYSLSFSFSIWHFKPAKRFKHFPIKRETEWEWRRKYEHNIRSRSLFRSGISSQQSDLNPLPSREKHNENEEESMNTIIDLILFFAPTSSPPSPHTPDLKWYCPKPFLIVHLFFECYLSTHKSIQVPLQIFYPALLINNFYSQLPADL